MFQSPNVQIVQGPGTYSPNTYLEQNNVKPNRLHSFISNFLNGGDPPPKKSVSDYAHMSQGYTIIPLLRDQLRTVLTGPMQVQNPYYENPIYPSPVQYTADLNFRGYSNG